MSRYNDVRMGPSSVSTTHPPTLTPGFPGTQMSIQSPVEEGHDLQEGDAHDEREPEFRANLNLTEDERGKNQHVTSWEKL